MCSARPSTLCYGTAKVVDSLRGTGGAAGRTPWPRTVSRVDAARRRRRHFPPGVVRVRIFGRIRARIRIYSGICRRIFVHDCPLKKKIPPTGSSGRHYVDIPTCWRKLMSNIVVLFAITVAQDIGYLSWQPLLSTLVPLTEQRRSATDDQNAAETCGWRPPLNGSDRRRARRSPRRRRHHIS